MRELLTKAKQFSEKITDEKIKQELIKAIAVLEKKINEFLSDVEFGFITTEELKAQLVEIQTEIKSTQKTINEIFLTDAADTHSKRNADAILKNLLEEGISQLQSALKEKAPSADKPPAKTNNFQSASAAATAIVSNSSAGRDLINTVNNNTIVTQCRLTQEEIQTNLKYWPLPKLSDHFVGRKSLLEQLALRLKVENKLQAKTLVINAHGLGGVGKTQLALKYIEKHKNDYQFVLWFSAESEESLNREYYNFAKAVDLPIDGQPPENIINFVKSWLQQNTGWLIVYDNTPNAEVVAKYRPQSGGNILITSRKDSWDKKQSINIDVFSLEESREYIVEITEFTLAENQVDIDQLAVTLGRLPLALAQACAYIGTNKISLQAYLALYEANRKEMLADKTMPAEEQHEPVAVTWQITFKAIKEKNLAASVLLESCAYLHADDIPEFLLKAVFNQQQTGLENQLKSFIEAVGCLQCYSMLKQSITLEKEKTFSLHRLVQDVMFDSLSAERRQSYLLEIIQVLQAIYPYGADKQQLKDYAQQRSLLPHMEKFLSRMDEWLRLIKHSEPYDVFQADLLQYIEKELLLKLLNLIANAYANLGETLKLKKLLECALLIYEKYYGISDQKVVIVLNNLSNAYADLGNFQKQKELLERALPIQEKHFGVDSLEVTEILNNLATANGDLGDACKQKELLERTLQIQSKYYVADHLEIARTLNNLGLAYGKLGDAQKQKNLLQRALKIQKQMYGTDHPQVARTLNNLALAYGELGDSDNQKILLEQILPVFEKHYGTEHPEVAKILDHLVTPYLRLCQFHEAKVVAERCYQILFTHPNVGPRHQRTQSSKKRLDVINQLLSELQSNPSSLQQVMAHAATQRSPLSHLQRLEMQLAAKPNDVDLKKQLIKELYNQGELNKALKNCEEFLKINNQDIEVWYWLACLNALVNPNKLNKQNIPLAQFCFDKALLLKQTQQTAIIHCEYGLYLLQMQQENKFTFAKEQFLLAIKLLTPGSYLIYRSVDKPRLDSYLQREFDDRNEFEIKVEAMIYYGLIQCCQKLNDGLGQAEYLEKLTALVEQLKKSVLYRLLSYVYEMLRDQKEADAMLTQALRCEAQSQLLPTMRSIPSTLFAHASEDEELQQAIAMSKQLNNPAASSAAVPTTFFQQPSSFVDEWQSQIQAHYVAAQQAKAGQESTEQKRLSN